MSVRAKVATSLVALVVMGGSWMPLDVRAQGTPAPAAAAGAAADAIDADARAVLAALSTHLNGLQRFSVEYAAVDEVITREGDRLQFLHSGTLTAQRPDRLNAVRRGAAGTGRIVLDGTTLWLFGEAANAYVRVPATTIAAAIEAVRGMGGDAPGVDLLGANPFAVETSDIVRGAHLGMTYIDGTQVHQLAFRGAEVDWQLWVTTGDRPLPLRYVVTSKKVPGTPQYTLQLRNWSVGAEAAPAQFTFAPPQGARQVEASAVVVNAIGDLTIRTP